MPPVNETETSAHDQQEQSPDNGPSESEAQPGAPDLEEPDNAPAKPATTAPEPADTTLGAIGKLVEEYLAQREAKLPAGAPPSAGPQLPSVGRIVHFYASTKGQPYPAVITHVHGPDLVNLHVFDDGTFPLGAHDCTRVSVMRTSEGENNCWSWPTRS